MNTQHKAIRMHKRVKRLIRKLKRMPKDNVYRGRVGARIGQLTQMNKALEYLTVLGA